MSIAAIHTIKGKLRLPEAEYRALLMRVAGVSSAKALTPDQDKAVVAALRALEASNSFMPSSSPIPPKTPQEAKIWALWLGTDDSPGLIRYLPDEKRNASYLAGIVGRFGKVEWDGKIVRFNRFTKAEAVKAIEALVERLAKEQAKMAGVPF